MNRPRFRRRACDWDRRLSLSRPEPDPPPAPADGAASGAGQFAAVLFGAVLIVFVLWVMSR